MQQASMSKADDEEMLLQQPWQGERQIIARLSSLNYRTGEIGSYLHNIAVESAN